MRNHKKKEKSKYCKWSFTDSFTEGYNRYYDPN